MTAHDARRGGATQLAAPRRDAYGLSGALVLVAAVAGAASFFVPEVLRGPAVMNGSARGTALVVLVVAVPALVLSMMSAAQGSARALIVWLGSLAYVLYNALMFLFGTPFNNLYVAMLSLSIWSGVAVVAQIDVHSLSQRFSPKLPARAIAVYVWVVVALNLLAWMRQIGPGILTSDPPSFLEGTGLPTNPVFVQDLAVWLPLMAVGAGWLWRREGWGYLVVGSVLTMWVIESLSIAVDQWFGHAADPASPVASAAVAPVFAVLAMVGLIPLYAYFRNLDRDRPTPRST